MPPDGGAGAAAPPISSTASELRKPGTRFPALSATETSYQAPVLRTTSNMAPWLTRETTAAVRSGLDRTLAIATLTLITAASAATAAASSRMTARIYLFFMASPPR